MFVGSMIKGNTDETTKQNLFQTAVANIKAKIAQKKLEKAARTKMMNEARLAALHELKPQMTEMMKQEELKKLTGEGKKDKLKKLAAAFSMKGTGIGSTNKINQMLGVQQPQQQPIQQQQQVQPQQQYQQQHQPIQQQPTYQQGQQQQVKQPQQKPIDINKKLKELLNS